MHRKGQKKKPYGSFEVESSCGEHDVDGIPEETLVEVAPEAVVRLAVPDDRLDARPLAEQLVLFAFGILRIGCFWCVGNHDVGVARLVLSPVAAAPGNRLDLSTVDPVHLLKRLVDGVAVELVAERQRPDDQSVPVAHNRHLVAELVLLVLLALADAQHVGLVERVYLVSVNLLAFDELQAEVEALLVGALFRKLAKLLADEAARYGTHPAVGLGNLLCAVATPPEPLRPLQPLQLPAVTLAHVGVLLRRHLAAVGDDLVQQLRVRRERHVLLLDGRVDEGRLLVVRSAATSALAVSLILRLLARVLNGQVDADALLQDQLHALFLDAVAKVDEFARGARSGGGEHRLPAEVLVVGVLLELLHHRLVRYVAQVLQDDQARHQADRLRWTAVVLFEQGRKRLLENVPVNHVGQDKKLVVVVKHRLQFPEHGGSALFRLGLIHMRYLQGLCRINYKILKKQTRKK